MIREVKFESQDRRIKQILACLNAHGISSIEEANQICEDAGLDPYMTCEETQMICFENAKWAYVVGTAIALKEKAENAVKAAEYIGEGLQAFCIPGSVADTRLSQLLKVLSRLPRWPTSQDQPTSLCVVSSAVWVRTLP